MSSFKKKLLKLKAQVKYFPKTIKLIWNSSKYLMIFWALILILLGIFPALQIYLVKPLIDNLSTISKNNLSQTLNDVYIPISILFFTLLFTPILSSLLTYIRSLQSEKVQNSIRKMIQEKTISLDMKHFEDSNYYDKLYRAHIDAINKPMALLENVGIFVQNSLTFVAILFILLPLGLWLPLILILSSLPSLFIALKFTLKFHNHRILNTKNERKLAYYDYLLTNNETVPEIKTFNLGNYFKKNYWQIKHNIQNSFFNLLKNQVKAEIISSLVGFLIVIAIMIYIINETINGKMTIGMVAMYYFAFTQGQRVLKTLFLNLNELYKNIIFLENLFEFLNIDNKKKIFKSKIEKDSDISIKIKNLYFKYPKTDKYVIENLTLSLKPNTITAIVGTNGSGKSTLIKLLNAFYYPSKGYITINNINIEEIEPKSIRKNITILFQNFIKYHLSVFENIKMGDTKKSLSTINLDNISQNSDINVVIKKLPNEYNTILGKWFGGVELSGGEWQKLALARAYFKNSKILILDEPTSAFDSWSEIKWLENFKKLCENKTALIITHRFTTAKHADIIHVMEKGKIIESGTHNELINLDGVYASSWKKQMNETQND